MPPNIAPLLTRLKKRFIRMPRSTGIFMQNDEEVSGTLSKSGDRVFTTSYFCGAKEFSSALSSAVRPHVLCICQGENRSSQNRELFKSIYNEYDTVIFASVEKVLPALGLSDLKHFFEWFTENSLEIKPRRDEAACAAVLSALTGFFYLADEFEYDAESGSVIPLLFECHELYSFLRQVPYGEITTFGEVAKVLGLQWNEARVMSELARLPPKLKYSATAWYTATAGSPILSPAALHCRRSF
jgi:O6-methylguanine-DNA--protein-cysteine methyltransferase